MHGRGKKRNNGVIKTHKTQKKNQVFMKKGPQAQYCTLPPTPKPSITKCDMLLSHDFTPEAADAPSTSIYTFAAQYSAAL